MEPIVYLETSVRNYYYSLRNNPERRSSHLMPCLSIPRSYVTESRKTRFKILLLAVDDYLWEQLLVTETHSNHKVPPFLGIRIQFMTSRFKLQSIFRRPNWPFENFQVWGTIAEELNFTAVQTLNASPSCRAVYGVGLRPLAC